MSIYSFAGLIIKMNTKYKYTKNLADIYKLNSNKKADIDITLKDDFLKKKINEHLNTKPEIIEHIYLSYKFSVLSLPYNCVSFHASGIKYKNKAFLFAGTTGVGKSTHTNLWQQEFGKENVKIINDDRPVIRIYNNKVFAYGTPFSGGTNLNLNIKAPVGGIVFLEKSNKNFIKKLSPKEAIPLFLENTIRKWLTENQTKKLLNLIEEIITQTPCYYMECTKSKEAVYTAKNKLFKQE